MDKYIKLICDLANSLSRTFYVAMTNTPFDDTDCETKSTLQTSSSNTRETNSATKEAISNKIDGTLTIPENTKVITKEMISPYRRDVKEIIIPNTVTSIGKYAFLGCRGLTSITIPHGVTSIGGWAFFGCSSLTSITIPNTVTEIGYCAFEGCSGLTSITIPKSVKSIGERAFEGCSSLTSIKIPNGVTSIEKGAFEGCSSLNSITIPMDVVYEKNTFGDSEKFIKYAGSETSTLQTKGLFSAASNNDTCNAPQP
jgi:hypothetical protein